MKALTICQPYASLIITATKRVENRSWATAYRGPLVIHAGKSTAWITEDSEFALPRGVILGTVDLINCVCLREYEKKYDSDDQWANGPWCWVLRNPQLLPHIPYRGAQGLFDIPDDFIKEATF